MDIATTLMSLVIYVVPFFILYFVVAAAVKKGIETSEVGRVILESHLEKKSKKK